MHSPSAPAPRGEVAAAGADAQSGHGHEHEYGQGQRLWRRGLAWALAVAALGAVFALYLQPTVLVTLADQVWACFN